MSVGTETDARVGCPTGFILISDIEARHDEFLFINCASLVTIIYIPLFFITILHDPFTGTRCLCFSNRRTSDSALCTHLLGVLFCFVLA